MSREDGTRSVCQKRSGLTRGARHDARGEPDDVVDAARDLHEERRGDAADDALDVRVGIVHHFVEAKRAAVVLLVRRASEERLLADDAVVRGHLEVKKRRSGKDGYLQNGPASHVRRRARVTTSVVDYFRLCDAQ